MTYVPARINDEGFSSSVPSQKEEEKNTRVTSVGLCQYYFQIHFIIISYLQYIKENLCTIFKREVTYNI